mmetsp:Transcript_9491/g.10559  ORF Transcript_9491/g.10559 Transcript_9491/m.10559 type:complete len:85 (-) Transcript_9491:317-571(-)
MLILFQIVVSSPSLHPSQQHFNLHNNNNKKERQRMTIRVHVSASDPNVGDADADADADTDTRRCATELVLTLSIDASLIPLGTH